MNEIKVKITFIPSTQGNITNRTAPLGNNISPPNVNTALQGLYGGEKPFILGASKLGGGDVFRSLSDKYSGFINSQLTGADGTANCTIAITGSDIDSFVLMFDRMAAQWATEIVVDGVVFINDDPQFVWKGTKANSHTILIRKWNLPLYPVRITSITIGLTVEFDRSNLKEVTRGSQVVAENAQPIYGVLSQYGSIEVYDYDGEMLDLDEMGLLLPDQNIAISIGDELIGRFYSEKWSVDGGVAKVSLTDKLIKWQDVLFNGYSLKENETALTVFQLLNGLSSGDVNISSSDNAILSTIKIRYNYLEPSTLFEAWNKLCEITQTNIYQHENGEVWIGRV